MILGTRDAPDSRPDNPAFLIFDTGIQPDTGFDLPEFRPDTGTKNSRLSGQLEDIIIIIHKFSSQKIVFKC
jgi:hypothetical protein